MNTEMVKDAPLQAFKNRKTLEVSGSCGCFGCQKMFPFAEVKSWTDQYQTALCPHCEREAVLPVEFFVNVVNLKAINDHWLS